jgi:hypothetical protein
MNICKACNLLEGLNRGLPKLGIGKTHRLRKLHNLDPSYSLNSSVVSLSLKSINLSTNCDSEAESCNNDHQNFKECCSNNNDCCNQKI